MLFKRYVQAGRLCRIVYGPDEGKLCFIVDIVDLNRVLIDNGGISNVERQSIPIKRLALTDLRLKDAPRGMRNSTLKKKAIQKKIAKKFWESKWGRKLQQKRKVRDMTDFERFHLMVVKKQRSKYVNQKVATVVKKSIRKSSAKK